MSKFDYKNNSMQTVYQNLCTSVCDKGKMFMVWAKRESFGLRIEWIYIKSIKMRLKLLIFTYINQTDNRVLVSLNISCDNFVHF